MICKIAIYLLQLSLVVAIWSQSAVDASDPELGPYYEGDILNPPKEGDKSGITDLKRRWKQNTLVYRIGTNFSQQERGFIYDAMDEIQRKTCIRFREAAKNDKDYAVYTKVKDYCSSYYGRIGGKQEINLAAACFGDRRHGTAMHETIHALGFGHEHVRPDRDYFVSIDWEKIEPDAKHNFEINSQLSRTFGVPYDYSSIMHYPKDAFGINGTTTIYVRDPYAGANIGQRINLSVLDAEKLNRMYECWY